MDLDGAYDPDNIFARIIRSEAPAARIYEDAATLAFMDVFPQARGHALVVSKASRARNLLDVEPADLERLIVTVRKVTRAVRAALTPDAILVSQFNGAVAGQTIYHLHFHIIPRWAGKPLGRHAGGAMAQPAELAALAREIAAKVE